MVQGSVKIGIMTFHWAANHGALLQTYALQKSLEELVPGSNVVIVDYKPAKYDWNLKKVINSRNLRVVRENLREVKKEKLLTPFRNSIQKTKRYYSVEQLMEQPPECDVFISGSDQIWNEYYTMQGEGKPTAAYYLPFGSNAIRISYAASFGSTSLKPEMQAYILPYLQELDGISVRERTGKEILDQMGIPCQIVCDPSVLMDREAYCNIAQRAFSGKYTAKYFLRGESAEAAKVIQYFKKDGKVRDITLLSMEKWVGAIQHAEFLLTNSFHGMMVALKLHVPFAIFLSEGVLSGMNDRFYTLLDRLGLTNRIVGADTSLVYLKQETINWNHADRVMEEYAAESVEFLQKFCMSLDAADCYGVCQ